MEYRRSNNEELKCDREEMKAEEKSFSDLTANIKHEEELIIIDEIPLNAVKETVHRDHHEVRRQLVIALKRCDEDTNSLQQNMKDSGYQELSQTASAERIFKNVLNENDQNIKNTTVQSKTRELTVKVERCDKLIRSLRARGEFGYPIHPLGRLECPYCKKCFMKKQILHNHIRGIHMGEFKCKFCEKLFTCKSSLNGHMAKIVKGKCRSLGDGIRRSKQIFQCNQCSKSFTFKKTLNEHIRGIHLGKYKCKHCKFLFSQKVTLEKHIRKRNCIKRKEKLPKLHQMLQCDLCPKTFSSKHSVKNHIEGIHLGKFKCEDCKTIFVTTFAFKTHLSDKKNCIVRSGKIPKECIIDNFDTSEASSVVHKFKTTALRCRFCNKTFQRWYDWNYHEQNTHERNGPIVRNKLKKLETKRCFFCNELWDGRRSLNIHMRKEHGYCKKSGRKITQSKHGDCLRCDHCSLTFNVASKRTLLRHLTDVHFTYRSDSHCHICYLQLKNVNYLQKHMERLHSVLVVHSCNFCFKTFSTKGALRRHMKIITREIQKCKNCEKRFCNQEELRTHVQNTLCIAKTKKPKIRNAKLLETLKKTLKFKHEKRLSPLQTCKFVDGLYQCNFCDYRNKNKYVTNLHATSEHFDFAIKCRYCSQQFTRHGSRLKHEETEHICRDDKPYCLLCKAPFNELTGLRFHLRNIHNYNPKPEDLGNIESRYLECFHCDAKFHLADKVKLTVHLTANHFTGIKPDWIRKSLMEPMFRVVEGLKRCKRCDKVVGKKGRKTNYDHLNRCHGKPLHKRNRRR